MNCADCGAVNPADAKSCGNCGHQMVIARKAEGSGSSSWDTVFKWIGMGVVGLFALGLLAGY